MTEQEAYQKAAKIAFTAMGKENRRPGQRKTEELPHRATEDPLAWWCLTELIMTMRET